MTAARQVSAERRALLAKVHMGAKDLGLDEALRRDLVERVTGNRSAGDCTDGQLIAVLDEYRAKGWRPRVVKGGKPASQKARPGRAPADHPVAKKARALWISLYRLGVVENRSEAALEAELALAAEKARGEH